MSDFLAAAWAVTLELAPWLLLGAAIAGVLHVALPRGFVRRAFSGRRGVLAAVALGVPLPLCSCGVIPAGLGLKKDGASDGAAVGFLISTPQTGVDSILVSASFLGWPFALFKVGAAALTGVVGGWLTDATATDVSARPEAAPSDPSSPRTLASAWAHTIDVLRSIWKWLAFGVLLSAAISTLMPPQWLATLGGHGELVALAVALLISVPLYVCATASVPIAAALVAGGLPAGAALVFLMAGPATNLATLGAVYRTLGRRTMLVYLGTIIVGSVALAYAFDFVLPISVAPAGTHEHGGSALESISAVLLLGMTAWFLVEDVRGWLASRGPTPAAAALEMDVDGMTCGGCVRKLERALNADERVVGARVELDPGRARVHGDLDRAGLAQLVRSAGFTPHPGG